MDRRGSVSIIIVTWNSRRSIERCVTTAAAGLAHTRGEIIVVDNASTDGTAELLEQLRSRHGNLLLVRNRENLGFAKAVNLGLRLAQGEWLLLLNPDAELGASAVTHLIACAGNHHAGLLGARHRHPDGTPQPSVRRLPTTLTLALLALKLHRILPNLPTLRSYLAADFDSTTTQPVEQPAGSCLLVTRTALKQLGPLDENFHLWFEDVDWCQRAKMIGLPVWYCAEASVTHHSGQSFRQMGTLSRQRAFNRSARRYARKHLGLVPWLLLWVLNPLSLTLAAGAAVWRKLNRAGARHPHPV